MGHVKSSAATVLGQDRGRLTHPLPVMRLHSSEEWRARVRTEIERDRSRRVETVLSGVFVGPDAPYVWKGEDYEPDSALGRIAAVLLADDDPWSRRLTEDSDDDYWNPVYASTPCSMSPWQHAAEALTAVLEWFGFERR